MFEKIKKILMTDIKFGKKQEDNNLQRKIIFENYLIKYSTKKTVVLSMFIIYNNLDEDLSSLLSKNDLIITFNYSEDDKHYEVMIESKNKANKSFYLKIVSERKQSYIKLASLHDFIDVENLTFEEMLEIVKNQIIEFYK